MLEAQDQETEENLYLVIEDIEMKVKFLIQQEKVIGAGIRFLLITDVTNKNPTYISSQELKLELRSVEKSLATFGNSTGTEQFKTLGDILCQSTD